MKHLLNNLSEEEKNSIRGQHTGGMQVNNSRFNTLLENKLGNSKPLVNEQVQSKEGRNNPVWVNFVSKLKNVYNPKILTFNSYDTPPLPSQSLNWGTAKSRNGKYAAAILSTDKRLPNEKMELFNSEDRKNQSDMHGWWKQRGYKSDGDAIFINFKAADKFAGDLSAFFKVYPPEKTSGIAEQLDDEDDYELEDENEPYIDLTDDEDDEELYRGAPERLVKHMDSGEISGTHKHGVGYTPNEFGKSLGHSSHPTSIPNYTKMEDLDDINGMLRMSNPNKGRRYRDLEEDTSWMNDLEEGNDW